mmetsp:Transcript_88426/g.245514  ORF Transcript_88426/g.245514 Transcript_88426/m.245514 type:complete len:250 (+) Transcript_88426:1047-1796(+)
MKKLSSPPDVAFRGCGICAEPQQRRRSPVAGVDHCASRHAASLGTDRKSSNTPLGQKASLSVSSTGNDKTEVILVFRDLRMAGSDMASFNGFSVPGPLPNTFADIMDFFSSAFASFVRPSRSQPPLAAPATKGVTAGEVICRWRVPPSWPPRSSAGGPALVPKAGGDGARNSQRCVALGVVRRRRRASTRSDACAWAWNWLGRADRCCNCCTRGLQVSWTMAASTWAHSTRKMGRLDCCEGHTAKRGHS